MIDYQTANLKELFAELKRTKAFLIAGIGTIEETYIETKERLDKKAVKLLAHYYESGSINKVFSNSKVAIKIIDNILADASIQKHYIKLLEKIALQEREKGLGDFKDDWLEKFGNQGYAKIYRQARDVSAWLDDCVNISSALENFIGRENPLMRLMAVSLSSEEIYLKTLGMKIKGDRIIRRNMSPQKVFNPTEKNLIYFLYFKFKNNKDECFSLESLARELKSTKGYLKNSMTNIGRILRNVLLERATRPTRIEPLIKNESRRGYRLNPRLFV